MKFLPLLGKQLKDDAVIAVLEGSKMEVVYDFDRVHENQPDKYWAAAKERGFRLGFDASQSLDVIFFYVAALEGFVPVDQKDCDIPFFSSVGDVVSHGTRGQVRTAQGKSGLFGVHTEWVRLEYERHTLHYEFRDGNLSLVTLSKVP